MGNRDVLKPVDNKTWRDIEKQLSVICPIRLIIDGYRIRMHKVEFGNRLVIVLFVNGKYNVEEWESGEGTIREKFYDTLEKYHYNTKARKYVNRIYGKRKATQKGYNDKVKFVRYYWTSFRKMAKHLKETCKSIEVCTADVEEHTSLLTTFYEDFNVG